MKPNYTDLIRAFNLDSNYQKCKTLYESKSFADILSVTRREMSHSAFVAELLKDNSFHGLGNYPLMLFLQTVLSRAEKQGTKSLGTGKPVVFPEMKSAILAQTLNPTGITVQPEWSFADADRNSGRVDILARCKVNVPRSDAKPVQQLNIIIENKIYASEQDSQTKKYYQHFNALLGNNASKIVGKQSSVGEEVGPRSRYNLYVYLTPMETNVLDSLHEPQCDCKECVQINYQDLVDGVIEPMLNHPALSQRAQFILEEYRRSLSVSFDVVEEKTGTPKARTMGHQGEIHQVILAVGKEEREQLALLWNTHSTLMKAAINEKNSQSDEDEDGDGNPKRVYYGYKGQPFCMSRLVEALVSDKLGEYTFDEMNWLFAPLGIKIISKEKKAAYFDKPGTYPEARTKDNFVPFILKQWDEKRFKAFTGIVTSEWGIKISAFSKERLSAEERRCLCEFYDAHVNLITTTLEVIKRTTLDQELRDEVESMSLRSIRRRDRTTYTIVLLDGSVRSGLSWGRLILNAIQDYSRSGETSEDILQIFGLAKDALKKWDGKITGKTGYFTEEDDRVELADGEFVIKRGWKKRDVESFISSAKNMMYEISEENNS